MPKVNLSNYGPFALKPGEKLLEELNRLLARMGPGGTDDDDVVLLKDSIKSGIYCLNQLKAPEHNLGDGLSVPHNSFWFSLDADGIERDLDTISNFKNPSAALADLGDSFVSEVRSALEQLAALIRQKQRGYEILEATGGRRRTRSARKPRNHSARQTRRDRKSHSSRKTRQTRSARNRV